jgi:hypothetical protein
VCEAPLQFFLTLLFFEKKQKEVTAVRTKWGAKTLVSS